VRERNNETNLLSFGSECCYGYNINNTCTNNSIDCGRRFANRGIAICCPTGKFYNVLTKICVDDCASFVVLDFLCISTNTLLDLRNTNGSLAEMKDSDLCNGKMLPSNLPICCPLNFYVNGLLGC
jgi:hypothetical protein